MDKRLYSYSRLTCFGHCKYEFYLNYIIKDDSKYLSEGNYYAEVGSYVHEILAMIFEGKLKVEDSVQYYLDHYEDNVFYKVKASTMDKTYKLIADYFAELDINWVNNYEILGVELKSEFKLEDYDFVGFIDLLLKDKRDGKIVVLDHKSSEYPFKINGEVKKKSLHSFESYKKQMYLYCHAVYQLYGEFPKEMTWNHFKDKGKFATIPFVKKEYDETMAWFKSTLKTIEKEELFEPSVDFFYCNNLCNFRNSCEYKKIENKK
ncbi:MAG: PD-(D/E)XK nuclease family protein [Bacteroidales bacterium]|nr:PD-(D/E)XK nuclease family protein [Bacteroidales bacterium]